MAGMLPGVEYARRRRLHQSGGASDFPTTAAIGLARRSFRLNTHHHNCVSFQNQRSMLNQAYEDETLGGAAREAKERLSERLRSNRKSEPKRQNTNSKEDVKKVNGSGRYMVQGGLHVEVYGSKKSSSKKFSWAKLSWKVAEQEECAICLDGFKVGDTMVQPPCAHRFHSWCLVPWLENNAHCPYCRMGILS